MDGVEKVGFPDGLGEIGAPPGRPTSPVYDAHNPGERLHASQQGDHSIRMRIG